MDPDLDGDTEAGVTNSGSGLLDHIAHELGLVDQARPDPLLERPPLRTPAVQVYTTAVTSDQGSICGSRKK